MLGVSRYQFKEKANWVWILIYNNYKKSRNNTIKVRCVSVPMQRKDKLDMDVNTEQLRQIRT